MNGRDALTQQYGFFYLTAKRNLEGFPADASVVQPEPDGNCANWILGHMLQSHNAVMGLMNEEPVWDDAALSALGAEPITAPDQALDWDAMVSSVLGSEARCLAAIQRLTDEQLDEAGFTDPFGQATTRGALLNLLAVHLNYHSGQLGLVRRLAGLPGAIRSPARASA